MSKFIWYDQSFKNNNHDVVIDNRTGDLISLNSGEVVGRVENRDRLKIDGSEKHTKQIYKRY